MTISVDICGRDAFKIKIFKGPDFKNERDLVKKIPGKKPIYGIDPATAIDTFKWWEVPREQIGKLLELFPRNRIIVEAGAAEVFGRWDSINITLSEAEQIRGEISWIRPPKYQGQEDYIRISRDKTRLICAHETRTGKSYSSLNRANVLGFSKILIVCPCSIKINWQSEVRKNLARQAFIYDGTKKQREKRLPLALDSSIVITSYTMIHELLDYKPDQIIFDEAHLLAHANTQTFDRAKRMVRVSDAGIQLLTGTPVLHKPKDLWAPVHLIYPEIAGEYKAWESEYEEVVKSFKKKFYARDGKGQIILNHLKQPVIKYIKEIPLITRTRNLEGLRQRTQSFMHRVKRQGVENPPDIIKVGMSDRQRKLYKSIKQNILLRLESGDLQISNALSEMTRLLQVAEGCFNIEPKWLDSGKVEFVKEYVKLYPNEKIIIWSRFKPITELLYNEFKNEAVIFNGDCTKNQKQAAIWAFQGVEDERELQLYNTYNSDFEPGEARIFLGTIDKVSTLGFNLNTCDVQIFTSYHWNGNINKQTGDRIKSPGKLDETIYLVSDETIEEKALTMILENLKVCQHILDGVADISFQQTQQLIQILRDD